MFASDFKPLPDSPSQRAAACISTDRLEYIAALARELEALAADAPSLAQRLRLAQEEAARLLGEAPLRRGP
jgi:hypothetical protein